MGHHEGVAGERGIQGGPSLARRTVTPAAEVPAEIARTLDVALEPTAVMETLGGRPQVVERARADEPRHQRNYFDGTIFLEPTEDGVILWRRPDRTWLEIIRGQGESIPYPDCLHIRARPHPRGSHVVMQWERHPITRSSALINLLLSVAVLAALLLHGGLGPAVGLVALFAAAVPVARFWRIRRARGSLLRTAYGALAPHEQGDADRRSSAFRVLPTARATHRLAPPSDRSN